jgi:hypothetical protein
MSQLCHHHQNYIPILPSFAHAPFWSVPSPTLNPVLCFFMTILHFPELLVTGLIQHVPFTFGFFHPTKLFWDIAHYCAYHQVIPFPCKVNLLGVYTTFCLHICLQKGVANISCWAILNKDAVMSQVENVGCMFYFSWLISEGQNAEWCVWFNFIKLKLLVFPSTCDILHYCLLWTSFGCSVSLPTINIVSLLSFSFDVYLALSRCLKFVFLNN